MVVVVVGVVVLVGGGGGSSSSRSSSSIARLFRVALRSAHLSCIAGAHRP